MVVVVNLLGSQTFQWDITIPEEKRERESFLPLLLIKLADDYTGENPKELQASSLPQEPAEVVLYSSVHGARPHSDLPRHIPQFTDYYPTSCLSRPKGPWLVLPNQVTFYISTQLLSLPTTYAVPGWNSSNSWGLTKRPMRKWQELMGWRYLIQGTHILTESTSALVLLFPSLTGVKCSLPILHITLQ